MSEYENFNDPNIYIHEPLSNSNKFNVVNNYLKLLNTYHSLFHKNIVTKKIHYVEFIYNQGMKCLNHVFSLLLHYTNNIQFTYYHCEKGIYYFTEFISQIENENSFLKLSSIDAIIFVYKKTIYNVNKKMANINKKPFLEQSNEIIQLITLINRYDNYHILSKSYINITNFSQERLEQLQKFVSQCEKPNEIVETLKQELQ